MAVLLLLGSGITARAQPVDAEGGFLDHIAQERSSRGIGGLAFAADLQDVARRHAQRMADKGEPYHNPNLGSEVQGWSIVAENVGVGLDVGSVHQAFMNSATHRDIILDPDLTQLGVGVVTSSDGRLWVVEVFRRLQDAPTPPPTSAPPAPPPSNVQRPPSATVAPTPTSTAPTAAPITTAPPTTIAAASEEAGGSPLPGTELADGVVARGGRSAVVGRVAAAPAAPVAPDLGDITRRVPPAAWAAAFLLAGVVGFQGQALRRLGLVA